MLPLRVVVSRVVVLRVVVLLRVVVPVSRRPFGILPTQSPTVLHILLSPRPIHFHTFDVPLGSADRCPGCEIRLCGLFTHIRPRIPPLPEVCGAEHDGLF